MTQNPIVQYIFMVIGILCLIRLLAMSTLLLTLALLISGLFALTIWLISEDKKTTDTICKYPAGNHWVNFVQNISKVMSPPPDPEIPDASGDDDDGDEGRKKGRVKIYMNEPEHFHEGKKWFKQYFKGHDDDIQVLFTNLETSIEMYSRSVEKEHQLRKPIASYLIIGPTGTGKTYCSELMSKLLYPKKGFLYLDLASLKDEYGVNLLFGESGGSSNFNYSFNRNNEQGGLLTRPILKNPHQMVLLDEIGRCHPAIHDSLYHVLDKGKSIEKSSGREVDFTNCVFFATANVSDIAQRKLDAEKKKIYHLNFGKKNLLKYCQLKWALNIHSLPDLI
ncbi:MAG: hypothetical protein OMM_04767 [Candidatus Magnetoglobus multicellularis str. Araruama]|uniref:AAA+ ATPase domain-containing protein n=1 Tax=Candidatus Magnetoglobus multicellularis str. Araruama TaxID=890399 RepID=A0A1V1NZW6_9BACT|nr:MAG: hypothetical protein OMM_04767 [Candidatus Magnetoglobus multicellularis str. Araruama]